MPLVGGVQETWSKGQDLSEYYLSDEALADDESFGTSCSLVLSWVQIPSPALIYRYM